MVGLGALTGVARADKDGLELISRGSGMGATAADGSSLRPSISADGRFVAFYSSADNLSDEDDNDAGDVFVRDRALGTTTFVSRASGPTGAPCQDSCERPSISGAGRYVAFEATENFGDADDSTVNVLVRDLETNQTLLASRATDGAPGRDGSFNPAVSGSGRFVAFDSYANNFSERDDNIVSNVFVRDLREKRTILVSRGRGTAANSGSFGSSISRSGRYVAFKSFANNLTQDQKDTFGQIFVRDLRRNTTRLVSRADGFAGAPGDNDSIEPSISADGRHVAFGSRAKNLTEDDNDSVQYAVFVRDLKTGRTTLASRAAGARGSAATGGSSEAAISSDGRFVAFQSLADNLSEEDDDSVRNVYVRDLQRDETLYLSRADGQNGPPADAPSSFASISGDGRYVAFDSDANNLSEDDTDAVPDVFVRDVFGGAPSPPERINPVLRTRIVQARQERSRIVVKVAVSLLGTRGRPCVGKVAVGAAVGGRRARRVKRLDSRCVLRVVFRFRVGTLRRSVGPRGQQLVVRTNARYRGSPELAADAAPTTRRRVRRSGGRASTPRPSGQDRGPVGPQGTTLAR